MFEAAVSDEHLRVALAGYAAMVHRVLSDPERWLSTTGGGDQPANLRQEVLRRAGRAAKGALAPVDEGWQYLTPAQRTDWWVRRLQVVGAGVAAAPRYAGLLADRLPVQAAVGTAVSGLAVCATAREFGVQRPEQWVPLLAEVLFQRRLDVQDVVLPSAEEAEERLEEPAEDDVAPQRAGARAVAAGAVRAGRTIWRLARTLQALHGAFDDRPNGRWVFRVMGNLPVLGLAGGFFDERGAIYKSAVQTSQIICGPPPSTPNTPNTSDRLAWMAKGTRRR